MRQLFACICEGKNQLTNRKILTHQALYGFDNKPQHNPTKDYKTSMQKLQKLSKKVSKLFNGMVTHHSVLLWGGEQDIWGYEELGNGTNVCMGSTSARGGMQQAKQAPALLKFVQWGYIGQ